MHWIAFGDVHEQVSALPAIPGLKDAAAVIVTGDLTNRGTAPAAMAVYEAIARHNPSILAQMGNMDTSEVDTLLTELGVNIHMQTMNLVSGSEVPLIKIMGVGMSTPTPFSTPSEVPEQVLGRMIQQTYADIGAYDKLILVSHTPPANTAVDVLPNGQHVGSPSVRRFIEDRQPDICLTGHIHEARTMDRIGKTTIINPGMLAHGGFARIEFSKGALWASLEKI